MPRDVPRLEAYRVVLRPLREDDKTAVQGMPRDAEYIRLNGGDPSEAGPRSRRDVEEWYESRPDSLRWIIEVDESIIGEMRFDHFKPEGHYATLAIGIWEPENWNRGYGGEPVERALEYAFGELDRHLVELYVLESNARAQHVYSKCGFKEDGRLRDRVFSEGRWLDDVVMSITGDEWRKRGERP